MVISLFTSLCFVLLTGTVTPLVQTKLLKKISIGHLCHKVNDALCHSSKVISIRGSKGALKHSVHLCNVKNSNVVSTVEDFDFSSLNGWNTFYKEGGNNLDPTDAYDDKNHGDDKNEVENGDQMIPFEYEWHSSIQPDDIITEISQGSSVLIVGAGNSALPQILYKSHNNAQILNNDGSIPSTTRITCLDFSSYCIDMLRTLYGASCPKMDFVCGDATKMSTLFSEQQFDYIIDKGLMDALMCGEGWDWTVESYVKGISSILSSDKSKGRMLLISYKLSPSTKQFLLDMGVKYSICWNFDIDSKSNERVSFSIGSKV